MRKEPGCKFCNSMVDKGSITCPKCVDREKDGNGLPVFLLAGAGALLLLAAFLLLTYAFFLGGKP